MTRYQGRDAWCGSESTESRQDIALTCALNFVLACLRGQHELGRPGSGAYKVSCARPEVILKFQKAMLDIDLLWVCTWIEI